MLAGALFTVLIASVLIFGLAQRRSLIETTSMTLSAVANQKIQQILQWTNRFLVEAEENSHHPDLIKAISGYVQTGKESVRQNLVDNIANLNDIYDFVATLVLDPDLKTIVASNENITLDEALMPRFTKAETTGKPLLSDLYMLPPLGQPGLAVIAPVFEANRLSGYIVNLLDAQKDLFPMLLKWPVPSETSETILVRRVGETIEFLSPTRFTSGSPLTFALPANNLASVEAKAMTQPGVVSVGDNYSHRKSFALAVKVENTDWYLVASMSSREALKPQWIVLVLSAVTLLLGAIFLAYLIITTSHRQSHLHYRRLFDIERETRATQAKFIAFMDNMPSMALIKDGQSRIIFANKEMQAVFRADEWLGKAPEDIFGPAQGRVTRQWDQQALKDGYVEYEEKRTNAAGATMNLLTQKFRILQEDGEPLIGQIVSDISERDEALERIRELKAKLEKREESD